MTGTLDQPAPASDASPHRTGTQLRLPDALARAVSAAMERAVGERWASRIWARDASVWTSDSRVAATIENRLGWLDSPTDFQDQLEELDGFAAGIREAGFTQAVVCGMGGSSLAPEVLAHGYPRSAYGLPVSVLDSTDPEAVRAAESLEANGPSLYLIATKSGTTTETLGFLAYFWEREGEQAGRIPIAARGDSFVAITDPGSDKHIPHSDLFRELFLNPPNVGGRYSALTYVGLVPGALLGLNLAELLADGALMAAETREDDEANPGLVLGVAMGALAVAGRDKLTLVLEPALAAFGAWAEQLIAESTGKHGTGIVPVDGEPLGPVERYGDDRVFVRVGRGLPSAWREESGRALDALATAGHPVIDITLDEHQWLGGEFFRWEFATAVAGAVLGVNPFDEPNVTESKENTKSVLDRFHQAGAFPDEPSLAQAGRLRLIGDAPLRLTAGDAGADATAGPGTEGEAGAEGDAAGGGPAGVPAELRRHFERARPNGYLCVQAYVAPTDERTAALREIQALLRDRTRRASALGYGPRFLHSTGQLHKGGPRTGCFLQLVAGHPDDLPIPGRRETFGALIDAQALGDFASLQSHELPVLRVHLSDDPDAGLQELRAALENALT
ncbi:MAG: transaldolase / glucose-6-phosphate isomerase [Chloroflexota bacterium]|jgi:glucose-6-phosphate isomerase|nr:transaldolase / glucose-6-phosphate isomerase [Chloroflexota bacterium]